MCIRDRNTPTTAPPSSALSPSTIDWPPEVLRKSSPKKAHSTHIATIRPLSTNNSSPRCLYGWSNSTSSQPHPLHAFVAFPLAQLSTQFHWCRSLSLISCHLWPRATPTEAPGWGQRWHVIGDTPTSGQVTSTCPNKQAPPQNAIPTLGHNTHSHTHTNCTQVLGHANKLN